ncbi:hypothetical protein C8J57DRAFT_1718848 [Mycena rebaudengoi]|nr:hypothetical protein C8J57DRAFT_1718848 [Mycena rebaudengoi]
MSYSALLPPCILINAPSLFFIHPSHTFLVPPCPPPLFISLPHLPCPTLLNPTSSYIPPILPRAPSSSLLLRTNTKHPPQNNESAQEEMIRNQALIQELIARTSRRRFRISRWFFFFFLRGFASSFFDGGVWWGRGVRVGVASRGCTLRASPRRFVSRRPASFLRSGYTPTGPVSGVLCAPPWAAALRALFRAVICAVAPSRVVSCEAGIHRRVPLLPFFAHRTRVVPAPPRVALCHGDPRRFVRRRYVYAAARFRSVGAMCGATVGCVGETDVHRQRGRGDARTVPRGIGTACVPRVWRRCGLRAVRRVVDERDVCGRRRRGDARALSLRAPPCDGPAPSHPRFCGSPWGVYAGRRRACAALLCAGVDVRALGGVADVPRTTSSTQTLRASGGTRRALRDSVDVCAMGGVAAGPTLCAASRTDCFERLARGSVVYADGAGKREHAGVDMRAMRGVSAATTWTCSYAAWRLARRAGRMMKARKTMKNQVLVQEVITEISQRFAVEESGYYIRRCNFGVVFSV